MFPYKLILQSLITVPKNLQLYTAATVNSSKLSGHTRANFHNVPCVENCKNGTIKKLSNPGVCRRNEIHAKYNSFSIPLEVYMKIRKVNHNSQITKIIHQKTKTNILHSKTRIFHQDTKKPLIARNCNGIFKHRLQVSQSTVRFISNRSGILPPPSNINNNKIDVSVESNEIPNYKINIKFNGTIPPPTSRNETIIHSKSKDLPESSFNIRMSKGKNVRPPSGTEKRCMNSGRIIKTNIIKKFNDCSLLKNKESVLKNLKCFMHITQNLRDVRKSKPNINKISKSFQNTNQNEIYYKQHFPNQFFPCPLYNSNDDRLEENHVEELKKNRPFIKSYLRPVNIPPPTPKKLKVQTSNSSLPPVYSLEVMKDLSSIKQKAKYPLLNLLAKTKKVVEKVQLENNPLPLNFNYPISGGMQDNFDNGEDLKKSVYVNMQGNDLRSTSYNSVHGSKPPSYMMDYETGNENQKSNQLTFNSDDDNDDKPNNENNNAAANEDYTVEIEKKKLNEKNNAINTEEQENSMYSETPNTDNSFSSSEVMYSDDKQENKLNTHTSSTYNNYLNSTWSKNDISSKNDGATQNKIGSSEFEMDNTFNAQTVNRNIYNVDENHDTEKSNSDVNQDQEDKENKITFHTFSNINTEKSDNNVNKMGENQVNKFNYPSFDENYSLSTKTNDNVLRMDENKVFQVSNMNNALSTEISNSSVPKIDESQKTKENYQTTNTNNTMSTEITDNRVHKIDETQENKVNYQTTNMNNNTLSAEINDKMDENQENKVNFETFGMNNSMSTVTMNNNNNAVPTESNFNNNTLHVKESPVNSYYKSTNFMNSVIPGSLNNNLSSYSGSENFENKENVQASSGISNTMMETMGTMSNNLSKIGENQIGNPYFNGVSNIGMSSYNNGANQMTNENIASSNVNTGMTNESRNEYPINIPNMLSNPFRKTKYRRPETGLMNTLSFMKSSKGLSDLAKTFNHASMFVPKQSLWRKFKFPAPAPSAYEQANTTFQSKEKEMKIPKFNNFNEARNYFVQPENLKKLTPSQVAMYNSILHYENVIKKHSDEMKRQKDNLELTQQALKHRKHKYYKHKSNFDE